MAAAGLAQTLATFSNSPMINELQDIVGPKGLLTEPIAMAPWSQDLLKLHQGVPMAVVRPAGVGEVSRVVALCAEAGIAVVPAGGTTGFCGGAIPDGSGRQLVLALDRMRAVREIDRPARCITVEAGCPLVEVQAAAGEIDCLFPLAHGGLSSQIGGNLATNAGGNTVLRYGMARELVLGLEVVLADGRVWNGLRKLRKANAGYDLKQLFIGSEGSLGVITAAVLRLVPAPRFRETALVAVADPAAALALLGRFQDALGEAVTAFELLPRSGLDLDIARRGVAEPFGARHAWQVLVDLGHASRHFDLRGAMEETTAAAMDAGEAVDAVLASSEAQRLALWAFREGLAVAQVEAPGNLKNDTAVPVSATPGFIIDAAAAIEALVPGAIPIPFGHVGDGNIHMNVNPPPGMPPADFIARWPDLTGAIEAVAALHGGSFSAEHGIGASKLAAAARYLPEVEREMMRRVKLALDPTEVMNPGKVIAFGPSDLGGDGFRGHEIDHG